MGEYYTENLADMLEMAAEKPGMALALAEHLADCWDEEEDVEGNAAAAIEERREAWHLIVEKLRNLQ
jgi:hypothetical protein